jgi:3-isopropylmalate/(R)-2-methylmalate dehydratase small subunit
MANALSIRQVSGTAVPILGNDVDTDRIIPARYLKEITFDKMGEYLFYDARFSTDNKPTDHPLNLPQFSGASIMVVENNFGCGSSREHAPQSIKRAGFNALIGESFAEIFSGNCKNLGVVTITLERSELTRLTRIIQSQPDSRLTIDLAESALHVSSLNEPLPFSIKSGHLNAFLEGTWDELSLLKLTKDKISTVANQLPYFNW